MTTRHHGGVSIDDHLAFGIATEAGHFLIQFDPSRMTSEWIDKLEMRLRLVAGTLRCYGFRGGRRGRGCAGVMHRFHSAEVCWLWRPRPGRRLLEAYDPQDWTTGAQLNMRSNAHFAWGCDPLAIYERAEPGICVRHCAATIAETELGVLTRDHRPLFL